MPRKTLPLSVLVPGTRTLSKLADVRPERVWCVAYGSNIDRTRFMRYLDGDDAHVRARDSTAPVPDRFATAPLELHFAGESKRWGGGVCFVDPDPGATAHVRAWDITAEQFEDVFAQENQGDVGTALPWQEMAHGPTEAGGRWYGLVVPIDLPFASAEHPAYTFTWTERFDRNPPSLAYRQTIERGFAEHLDLTPSDIDQHLNRAAKQ